MRMVVCSSDVVILVKTMPARQRRGLKSGATKSNVCAWSCVYLAYRTILLLLNDPTITTTRTMDDDEDDLYDTPEPAANGTGTITQAITSKHQIAEDEEEQDSDDVQ